MSVFSLDTSHGNPVTTETVDKLCSQLGVTIKDDEKEDYRRLLAVFHDASEQLMGMDGMDSFENVLENYSDTDSDYLPPVDEQRFPRENIHFPEKSENSHGAWAWRCNIVDQGVKNGKLAGKTFAIKDNVAVKDVPMLLGTNFIKDYSTYLHVSYIEDIH